MTLYLHWRLYHRISEILALRDFLATAIEAELAAEFGGVG